MKKRQTSAHAARSGSSRRVRSSATAMASAAASTAIAETVFAVVTDLRASAPSSR